MIADLSIIIVNWNGGLFLRRCIESIVNNNIGVSYDIIVVDNASSDESPDWLSSDEARDLLGAVPLRLMRNRENVGFGRANNQAFQLSKAPFLFLVNPDTEVLPNAIDKLSSTLQSDHKIGACGPRLLNQDGSLQPSVWHNPPSAWRTLLWGLKLYRLIPPRLRGEILLHTFWEHDRQRDVKSLSGAAIMLKRKLIDSIGGFDERFYMYGEDVEFCFRTITAGWRIVFEPEAEVIHYGGKSASQKWECAAKSAKEFEGFAQFQLLCLPLPRVLRLAVAECLIYGLLWICRKVRGQPTAEVKAALQVRLQHARRVFHKIRISI